MKEYLFSYGTLQKQKVQMELFGKNLKGSADILRGYRVTRIEIKDQTFLSKGEQKYQQTLITSKNNSDLVEGTVFEISKEQLFIVDKYEPDSYKRTGITLESGKRAWIYLAVETSTDQTKI